MRINTDKTFKGEDGMLKVWNATPGAVQVSDEGHLLDRNRTAWVDDNDTVRTMIDEGHLLLLEGSPVKSTKKNLKPKSKSPEPVSSVPAELPAETSPMFAEDTDSLLAVQSADMAEPAEPFKLDSSELL